MDLATVIAAAGGSGGSSLRTGRVLGIGAATITVDIGSSQLVSMPYLDTYLPVLGDRIQAIQHGSVCVILGAVAGMPDDNVLVNPSFERDAPGTAPTSWNTYLEPTSVGTATALTQLATGWGGKGGVQWLEILHGGSGSATITVSSEAISVQPGQVWTASAAMSALSSDGGASQATAALSLAFFPTSGTNYPTGLISSTRIQLLTGPTGPTWVTMRDIGGTGTVVPGGATAMRVLLQTTLLSEAVYWDRVICRRLT